MNYVGFGPRLVALLVDGLIIGIINWVLNLILLGGAAAGTAATGADTTSAAAAFTGAGLMGTGLSLVISILYWVVYQGQTGQTVGKKIMGIKVVTSSGKTPSMGTLFLRETIGKFVSSLILGIGYLMILWDEKKQGLHDKIASTYVVKAK
jgi:uncharacterized RDD family membrane protein YckC